MTQDQKKYITEKAADELAQAGYVSEAIEMLGKGYEPSIEISRPHKAIVRAGKELQEIERAAFVKISTSFKGELKDIGGDALKVWLFIALSINRRTEQAHPGLRTIADSVNLAVNTVRKAITELENAGLLAVNRGSARYNIYEVPEYVSANRAEPTVSNGDTVLETVSNGDTTVSKPNETVSPSVILNQRNQNNQSGAFSAKDIQQSNALVDAILSNGRPQDELTAINAFEQAFGLDRPWNWYPDAPADKRKTWKDFREYVKKLYSVDPDCFTKYVTWSRQDYVKGSMTALGIKRNPQDFPDSWSAFSYSTKYHPETKTAVKRDENNIPVTY